MLNAPHFSVLDNSFGASNRSRVVLIVSSDASLRDRLRISLTKLRWQVLEAPSGATASWEAAQVSQLDALLVDSWLPDLQVQEFLTECQREYPNAELMTIEGISPEGVSRSHYRQELLYALSRSQESDTAILDEGFRESGKKALVSPSFSESPSFAASETNEHALLVPSSLDTSLQELPELLPDEATGRKSDQIALSPFAERSSPSESAHVDNRSAPTVDQAPKMVQIRGNSNAAFQDDVHSLAAPRAIERIPELIGNSPSMMEVSRRIRLVAARATPVLIEGPTGSGKEVVAEALHRLSTRARKRFVAINCAAIPEALLEAELFGHTRGAFTGAIQGRIGRIESADGGTLFLDEIGEMPLALQSKLLRFFESGEIQRIGDNETLRVDVRLIAATHQPLAENAQKGSFRADLYYRLAVFLIHTPALSKHMSDLGLLVAHFMERMGRNSPVKRVDSSAMHRLGSHDWPGNVRELEHVLERGVILAGDSPVITASEIDFGLSPLN